MKVMPTTAPEVLSAGTLIGNKVINAQGEDLGKIEEIMLDLEKGCVSYTVLSFGGILGLGDKLFAVPWDVLKLDTEKKAFILNVDKDKLRNAPGFDKNNWPEHPDREWMETVYTYYGSKPHWK